MKKRFLICAAAVLCLFLLICTATADSITLNGKTIPAETIQISAPVSGTAEKVSVEAGQKIQAEDTLYTMKTTKIYADRDGTVAGVFGQPGDDAETVGTRYGAILYLEESPAYTVSASTSNAYNSLEAKHVHTGETVFVVSRTNTARTGKGIVTAVSGTSYTVEITEGVFLSSESVELFRNEEYDYDQKIGRGTISRTDPTAVTAAGAIVKIAVKNGDEVKRGDLLLETLDRLEAGTLSRTPQPKDGNYVGMIRKSMGEMDFTRPAAELERLVRGLNPWPSAYTFRGGKMLKIWKAAVIEGGSGRPGEVIQVEKNRFLVQTGEGILAVLEVQPEGKKRMPADAYLRGYPMKAGECLGKGL